MYLYSINFLSLLLLLLFLLFVVQVDESVDVTVLATYTPGCSGSDIREVIIVDRSCDLFHYEANSYDNLT